MLRTGWHIGSTELISVINQLLVAEIGLANTADDQSIKIVVFLFKVQYLCVQSGKPIVIAFMAAAISTVWKILTG